MEKKIYIVIAHYAPYTHNGLTEHPIVITFSAIHHAMQFINGEEKKGEHIGYKYFLTTEKPMFEVGYNFCGATYTIPDSIISDEAKKQGGYIKSIELIEDTINL